MNVACPPTRQCQDQTQLVAGVIGLQSSVQDALGGKKVKGDIQRAYVYRASGTLRVSTRAVELLYRFRLIRT